MRSACTPAAVLLLFATALPVFASDPEPAFQDATLVRFSTVDDGESCTTSVNQPLPNSGVAPTASTSCDTDQTRLYTLLIGGQTFTIRPAITGKRGAATAAVVIGTLGYGALFMRNREVLRNQLPGAHILVRSSGEGLIVKLGKKQSFYRIVSAQ